MGMGLGVDLRGNDQGGGGGGRTVGQGADQSVQEHTLAGDAGVCTAACLPGHHSQRRQWEGGKGVHSCVPACQGRGWRARGVRGGVRWHSCAPAGHMAGELRLGPLGTTGRCEAQRDLRSHPAQRVTASQPEQLWGGWRLGVLHVSATRGSCVCDGGGRVSMMGEDGVSAIRGGVTCM